MTQSGFSHEPVLLEEALAALRVRSSGFYVDGTLGRGGHSQAILHALGTQGRLLAIDRDPEAVAFSRSQFAGDSRVCLEVGSFAAMQKICEQYGWLNRVNGVLLDLGVSSPQLDDPERGFSFLREGPLDMRINRTQGRAADQWLNVAPEAEIAQVLKRYGEERFARRIAKAIVAARRKQPIHSTAELASIVASANPRWESDKHPATRTFLAIRVFINQELEEIEKGLPEVASVLAPGGRLAVISFHSLEDRIVKRFIRNEARGPIPPPGLAVPESNWQPRLKAIGKPLRPSAQEQERNPRARSAILRVAERCL